METHTNARIARVRAVHSALTDAGPAGTQTFLTDAVGAVELPSPGPAPTAALGEALRDRRSRYAYGPLGSGQLSSLLRWSLGPQRTVHTADEQTHSLNMHPSAGGLPSITVYLLVLQSIQAIDQGAYIFDRGEHRLHRHSTGDVRGGLSTCLVQPEFAQRAAVVVVLAGDLDVALSRYSERHYRTLHIDAGHAAANMYLVATALRLACCAISGFYDERLATFLPLGVNQIPLLAFALGARSEVGQQR